MGAGSSTATPVRLVALGGLGEIGLNLTVLECAGYGLVVDAGVMFPEDRLLGAGTYIPDVSGLLESKTPITAVVLTHAHEDHIGALPYVLRHFQVPVYGTEVTLAFARRRVAEVSPDAAVDFRLISARHPFAVGPFQIEPLRVTHSTPESVAVAIRTPAGLVVHSGDFKIDEAPVDGERFDTTRFEALGEEGVLLLLSDSTNVESQGCSGSESSLRPVLGDLVSRTSGRFFFSAFSSHLHRIRQVVEISRNYGRRVVPLGRRMGESVRLGLETGQLPFPPGAFVDIEEAEFLPPLKLTFLASGSQAEPSSALAQLARSSYLRVSVEPGDTIVLSSRFIPGNERAINCLVNHLYKLGAEVFYSAVAPVHVSGHAARDELLELIRMVRPRYFVPIHGEYRHLSRHVRLAIEAGIPEPNCFLLEDGDSLVLAADQVRHGGPVHTGRILVEGGELEDVSLISERRSLAHDGTVVAIVAVSARTGLIVSGPELVTRGLVTGNGTSAHIRRARAELAERLSLIEAPYHADDTRIRDETVRTLRRYFSDTVGKRPFVIAHVMEVP